MNPSKSIPVQNLPINSWYIGVNTFTGGVIRYSPYLAVVPYFSEILPLYLIDAHFPKNSQNPVPYRHSLAKLKKRLTLCYRGFCTKAPLVSKKRGVRHSGTSIKTLVTRKCFQKPENVHTDVSLFIDIDVKAFCNHLNFWRFPRIVRRKSHLRFKFTALKSVLLKMNVCALFGKCSGFKIYNVCYLIRGIFWTRQKYFPSENIIIIWVNFYPFDGAFCPIF